MLSQKGRARLWWGSLLVLLILVVAVLYRPALGLQLVGDDYEWVALAKRAQHDLPLLFADLDSFYRPASTWTLIADRLLWGYQPAGFHLSNLLLHLTASFLLALVARRLGLGPWLAAGIALLWAGSVFTSEPAISVSSRFQSLLLISWLALLMAWPRRDQPWTRKRMAAVAGALFLAVFSKETWVVTPALVAVLEWAERGPEWRRILRSVAPVAVLSLVYIAIYVAAFPSDKGYYRMQEGVLLKVPHKLAAFLHFEVLRPLDFQLRWTTILAVVLVVAAVLLAARVRASAGLVGAALIVLPTLPTLLVPYLPIRYTAIPYAGFLLLAGACVELGLTRIAGVTRQVVMAALLGVAALVLTAGVLAVRADLADWSRVSGHHARLLEEARQVAGELPMSRPVIVVRGERSEPLAEVARDPRGLAKLWYPRHSHPYGLIDAAALFNWVLRREDVQVRRIEPQPVPAAVLVHREGGFSWAEPVPDARRAAERWTSQGLRLCTVEMIPFAR